jgi:hypothetical protein
MYLKYPNVERFGLPRFHITNCKTILEQRAAKRFEGRYFWHNSKTATIEDRANGHVHINVNLTLCGNCERQSKINEYSDSEGFLDILDQQDLEDTTREIQLDIFGRPLNWDTISKAYRHENNYTCENCGFGGDMLENLRDREFIHTDHLIAWELANMRRNNLQCLCILCHSEKDNVHRLNFSKPGMQKRIKRFMEKYKSKLEELGNEYINKY